MTEATWIVCGYCFARDCTKCISPMAEYVGKNVGKDWHLDESDKDDEGSEE